MQQDTVIRTKEEMDEFAKNFAKVLLLESKPTIILVSGEMGAGKTYLAKKVGEFLNVKNIKSPSYTIIDEHEYSDGKFIHIDLYNVQDEKELKLLDLAHYLQRKNIIFIEWADLYMSYFDQFKDMKLIKVNINQDDDIRIIKIEH